MISLSLAHSANQPNPSPPNSLTAEKRVKFLTISAIFVTILFWASAFPAIRVALTAYTPAEVAFLRYIVASVVLLFDEGSLSAQSVTVSTGDEIALPTPNNQRLTFSEDFPFYSSVEFLANWRGFYLEVRLA